jgi:hypothetical protein
MNDLKRDDLDWRRGRHAAFVWHADDAVETVAREAYALFMTENGLGMRVFPSLRRMEADVVAMVAGLLGGDASVMGHMTAGGTESIFLAAHAAREWARRHRLDVTAPEIVAAFSAHPAIDKAAHYLGMRVVRVPTGSDFRADVAAMAAAVTPQTVMCYASAPTYSLGVVDPVAELGALAEARGLWLHVDACVGGVLGPFVRELGYPVPAFGLDLPGVASLSADLHKSGYAAKGASVILYRDAAREACGRYEFSDWPTGLYAVPTFAGTRPGGRHRGRVGGHALSGRRGLPADRGDGHAGARAPRSGAGAHRQASLVGRARPVGRGVRCRGLRYPRRRRRDDRSPLVGGPRPKASGDSPDAHARPRADRRRLPGRPGGVGGDGARGRRHAVAHARRLLNRRRSM